MNIFANSLSYALMNYVLVSLSLPFHYRSYIAYSYVLMLNKCLNGYFLFEAEMATKRKMVPPLALSLYHDLDVGSNVTEKSEDSTNASDIGSDSSCSMQKKFRNENTTSEGSSKTGENDGAGRWTIASFS